MAIDLTAVEQELRRIPDVRAARIVADDTGTPVEVHVLAAPGKHAKQLVRDVQSVAIATQGLEIDHRIVSVVQLDDDDGFLPFAVPAGSVPMPLTRASLERVLVERRDVRCTVTVVLNGDGGGSTVQASTEGSAAATASRRLAADATLAALAMLNPTANCAALESIHVVPMGEVSVAVALLTLVVPPYEENVTGSAPVRPAGVEEAVARAVLDACNRRLSQLG